jgi:hypothetical protein
LHDELLKLSGGVLPVTEEVLALMRAYESRKILPKRYRADMTHIALATVAAVDAVVSWNFKHIVRLEKIRLFNAVNVESGYRALSIPHPARLPRMKAPSMHAVNMVRRIRDAQARALARKSPAEVIAYYRAAGMAATARVVQRKAVNVQANQALQPTSRAAKSAAAPRRARTARG